jgi:hypothetical protein
MNKLYWLRPAIISTAFLFVSQMIIAQCSTTNPAACSCPGGGTTCLLLPDITAGKRTLNSTTGWTEYMQSAASPNKGLLRLDVSTPNIGWGPIETVSTNNYLCGTDTLFDFVPPSGFLCPDGSYPKRLIKQRLYQKNGNSMQFIDRDAGWMVYHPAHGHIHIEGWGLYTLRLRDVTVIDTLQWPIVNSGVKVSFCLIDLTTCTGSGGDCVDANGNTLNNVNFPNYGLGGGYSCNNIKQGISVGKVDIYHQYLDESFVKIPYEACNGSYHVTVQIDPDNHFQEMNENNNWLAAQIPITKQRTANTGAYAYIFSKKGNTLCTGSTMQLEASGASNYLWSTGATTQKITINQPGNYWVRATTPCGITTSDTLVILQSGTSAFPAITTNDTLCAGERANLYASGNAHWYDAPTGGNLVFIGNNYQTGNLFNTTTFYVADQPSVLSGNLAPATTTFSGTGNYTASRDQYVIFNAFLPFKLKKVKVDASTAGVRIIQLRDQYGHMLQEKSVTLVAGIQDITLDFFVPAGLNHQLGLSFSSPVPNLYTSTTANANIGYPYKLKTVANIVGSSFGDQAFPFFYNWQVEATNEACNSGQRKPVIAHTVPAPAVTMSGLLPVYNHAAFAVPLTGAPAGGTFSGAGVQGNYFYPRVAGLGTYIITYTYSNGFCTSQVAKETNIVLDETLLDNGFSVQLIDHPGPHPLLWVVSRDNSTVEVQLLTSTGQLLHTMEKPVYPGGNFINLEVERYPKAVYMLKVRHAASGKTKTLKLLN